MNRPSNLNFVSVASKMKIGDDSNDFQLKRKTVFFQNKLLLLFVLCFCLYCASVCIVLLFVLCFCLCCIVVCDAVAVCIVGCVSVCIISFLSHPLATRAWAQLPYCFRLHSCLTVSVCTAALLFPFAQITFSFPSIQLPPADLIPLAAAAFARAAHFFENQFKRTRFFGFIIEIHLNHLKRIFKYHAFLF
ncbi:hypothetical protein MmiAt1_00700 [Methanimicrococcus sp. At1]|uniref:Uncharacterized protein n=1 Tax=Methanimicrococcus hacksteinii TaxID=3028293 RepID=A0ABU3VMC0_9EURY|nr:hypothetical protein [Methanimicrococcus sp. At1]